MDNLMKQLPLALRIKEEVKADMLKGVYGREEDCFITVRELAVKTGASLVTAQKVMSMLQEEGLVGRKGRRNIIKDLSFTVPVDNRLLGLLVTNLENPFFAQLAKQVELSARARGLEVISASSDYNPVREREVLDMFARKGVVGVVACPCDKGFSQENFHNYTIPFVFIARRIAGVNADAVLVRNHAAGQDVARHLLDCGYTRFAYIGVNNFSNDPRRQGFFDELAKHGYGSARNNVLLVDNYGIDSSTQALTAFLDELDKPAGVFCFHDLIAARLLKLANRQGLTIPRDLAVVGFDNLPVAAELIPSLSTVAYPVDEMADIALQRLESLIKNGAGKCSDIYISPRLVVRESTRCSKKPETAMHIVPACMAYNII